MTPVLDRTTPSNKPPSTPTATPPIEGNARLIGVLDATTQANLPKFLHHLSAGIPANGTDDIEIVDLNQLCLDHPADTFLYQAGGLSMLKAGIDDGDYLLVDKSIEAKNGQLVAAAYFGESLIKQLVMEGDTITLVAHSDSHQDLTIEFPDELMIIGVVTWVFADKRGWRV